MDQPIAEECYKDCLKGCFNFLAGALAGDDRDEEKDARDIKAFRACCENCKRARVIAEKEQ